MKKTLSRAPAYYRLTLSSILVQYVVVFIQSSDSSMLLESFARVKDRHDNTALHIACSHYGVSKEVLKQLLCMDPCGLRWQNFHGKTPLQLLQERIAIFDDDMSVFLMQHNEEV